MTLMADCFDANLRVLDSRSESEICQTLREPAGAVSTIPLQVRAG